METLIKTRDFDLLSVVKILINREYKAILEVISIQKYMNVYMN